MNKQKTPVAGETSNELPPVPSGADVTDIPMEMTSAEDEESPEAKRLRWKRERHRALGGTD